MTRVIVLSALWASVLGVVSASAHHSYSAFDRNRTVSIEGDVERVSFTNPHVMLTIKTSDAELYTAEWQNINQLAKGGVTGDTVKVGDRLVVSGSPKHDNERLLSLIQEVRRPSDGWSWTPRAR